jgi:hypothetical protein
MYVKQENNSVDTGRESMLYVISNENTIELKSAESEADNVVIPATIDAANGQVYYVTVVCANALSDVSQVTRVEVQTNPQMGLIFESGSFNSCGDLSYLSFIQNSGEYVLVDKENATRAKKSGGKIVLEKNCLKGTHKNLLIEVPDKKTMKSIKKQLKKAKAPKGTKVKVAK